jgi:hypothetical protein
MLVTHRAWGIALPWGPKCHGARKQLSSYYQKNVSNHFQWAEKVSIHFQFWQKKAFIVDPFPVGAVDPFPVGVVDPFPVVVSTHFSRPQFSAQVTIICTLSWPSSSGLRGRSRTYLTILKLADHVNSKFSKYLVFQNIRKIALKNFLIFDTIWLQFS